MLIQRMDPARLQEVYNIGCQGLYPLDAKDRLFPFGSTYCEVPPGGFTTKHHHHENETFLILAGAGRMQIAGEVADVAAGDVVLIPALSHHRLDNVSASEPLKFVSIYWCAPHVARLPKQLIVIPAPPTPNGPLHVGHLSGPYLASDVFTRYANLRGATALHAMGTDDNQCYVAAKGRQLGLTGEEVAARFVPKIMGALEKFGCTVHERLHPLGVAPYTAFVQRTFTKLVASGSVELRRVRTPFCEDTGQFLYGAQVAGGCPGCGQPTGGQGCEGCGAYNDGHDLVDPRSNLAPGKVSLRDAEKYYFPLSKHTKRLRRVLAGVAMHPALRAYTTRFLDRGLPDVAVSQFGTWGVPCPGRPGQVLYEWFEMAGSYLYLSRQAAGARSLGDFFTGPDSAVVECFGFDNSFFYAFLVPALIAEIDPAARPPCAFLFNHFYQLEGKKFSTSRQHAIWADDILAAAPPDALRFYLARTRSEDRETSFALDDLVAYVRTVLVGEWETFLRDLDHALTRFGRTVSAYQGPLSSEHERLVDWLDRALHEVHEAYSLEHFSLNRAARQLAGIAGAIASGFYRGRDLAVDDVRAVENNLTFTLQGLRAFASLLSPIMPGFGGALADALGGSNEAFSVDPKASGQKVGPLPTSLLSEALAGLAEFEKARACGGV